MSEIEWAAFHISEDEKEFHETISSHRDMLLSFVNPAAFKSYRAKTDKGSQIENEAFEEEIKSKTGFSLDQLDDMSSSNDYKAEDVLPELDIIGEPTVM